MADISKDELRKEITAILKDADLTATSSKKVRQELEEKLDCDLISRKKEIDDLVMEYVHSKDKKSKKKQQPESEEEEEEDEEEDEEESEEEKKPAKRGAAASKKTPAKKAKKASSDESASEGSEAESDEEYSPKKAKPPKGRKLPPKKKKGSDSDSDEDWGKSAKKSGGGGGSAKKGGGGKRGGGGGYTKAHNLSPELASLMGQEVMARHEVVKKIWQIIKERDLYDPKNKQFAICDDDLFKVMGVKRFRTFGMMKYLKTHFVD